MYLESLFLSQHSIVDLKTPSFQEMDLPRCGATPTPFQSYPYIFYPDSTLHTQKHVPAAGGGGGVLTSYLEPNQLLLDSFPSI